MLHDAIAGAPRGVTAPDERRRAARVPFPGELIVRWFHAMDTPLRYPVTDAGEGGYRVRAALPLLEGMTGIATRLLPGGRQPEKAVSVAWVKRRPEGGYEVGLRAI